MDSLYKSVKADSPGLPKPANASTYFLPNLMITKEMTYCEPSEGERLGPSALLSAFVTAILSSPFSEHLNCLPTGCLKPCPNLGCVAKGPRYDHRLLALVDIDLLHHVRPLREAQVHDNAPKFPDAIKAQVNRPPRNHDFGLGWSATKFTRLLRLQGVRPDPGRGAVFAEVNCLLRLSAHHGGEVD